MRWYGSKLRHLLKGNASTLQLNPSSRTPASEREACGKTNGKEKINQSMPPKMLAWKHYIHEEVQCTFHVSGAALGSPLNNGETLT
jgi:hypothetical protein